LLGALVGAAMAVEGVGRSIRRAVTIAAALFLPLLGFVLATASVAVSGRPAVTHADSACSGFWCSSGFASYEHGQNDAQKVMGVIAISLFAGGMLTDPSGAVITDPRQLYVPTWVVLACGTVIALGTGIGGWRVIRTLGSKLAHLTPVEGFAAEGAGGPSWWHLAPVSTTHTITGAIPASAAWRPARALDAGAKILYA
jgi:PiT family inorganic phosphate transporter